MRFFGDENPTSQKISVPLLRTVKETATMIKELDPHTEITEYFIRCLARTNKIKTLTVGKKVLINWKSFLDYLELARGI